jgi:hypothetical protein
MRGTSSCSTRPATLLALAALVLAGSAPEARADDAASEWNFTNNQPTYRWNYGWKTSMTGPLLRHDNAFTDAQGLQFWRQNPNVNGSVAIKNPTASAKSPATGGSLPGGTLALLAGSGGAFSVVRWTADVAGTYAVRAAFVSRSTSTSDREVAVVHGGEVLFASWIQPAATGNGASLWASVTCAAGDTIDFLVGPGLETGNDDLVGVDATVNWSPPADPRGPVMAFGPHRFAVARWPNTLVDQIAFDPVNRRLAGAQGLRDLCGSVVVPNEIGEGQGLAWDPVTLTFWQVTNERVVRRYGQDGLLLDTLFTVPPTFVVPGSGLDTLEAVRGIAVDSSHVYLVDAGPAPGEIPSNAWFKFTRAGAPVKSSRSTDLLAHLDADPDALVDDIVWVPASSPVFPGRLLVALEHSGIQVLDTEGNFVDAFRWSAQNLPPDGPFRLFGKLSAFAGLAIDPLTGNLYLEDNGGGAEAWVRLEGAGEASYAVSISGPGGWLEHPQAGCNLALWAPVAGVSLNLFGLAWRPADGMAYALEYNTGDLWRIDPRSGTGWRVGPTGAFGTWGIAYAEDRDVLYGLDQYPDARVVTIDPLSGRPALLPNLVGHYLTDIAFDAADGHLYGIEDGAPPRLIRVDRDTGIGVVVGDTRSARGLDWDPVSGRLWGVSASGAGVMWEIDPATGAADTLTRLPGGGPGDALAVIHVPVGSGAAGVDPGAAAAAPTLRAWPNPGRGETRIEFAMPLAGDVRVRVFDVQGRLVREVQRGRLAAGAHTLRWDGNGPDDSPVASGVYFARVETGASAQVVRLVRVR